jgi:hypothetical protein
VTESKYTAQGREARRANKARASCRYTAKDIVRDWNAGWDLKDQEITAARLRHTEEEATFRWVDSSDYSQGERGKVEPRQWKLLSSQLGGLALSIRKVAGRWVIRVSGLTAYPIENEIPAGGLRIDPAQPADEAKTIAIEYLRSLVAVRRAELEALQAIVNELPSELPNAGR